MRQALRLHPDSRCDAARRIDVDVERPHPGTLVLTYAVTGAIGDLYLPPVLASARADELWRRTCFEAFVRPSPGEAYFEFNLSPSTQWAGYRFDGYRTGMRDATGFDSPRIEVRKTDDHFELRARLDLERLPGLPADATWTLALSAVIEEISGRKSYWALAHPPGQADFHHPDGFGFDLPTAEHS